FITALPSPPSRTSTSILACGSRTIGTTDYRGATESFGVTTYAHHHAVPPCGPQALASPARRRRRLTSMHPNPRPTDTIANATISKRQHEVPADSPLPLPLLLLLLGNNDPGARPQLRIRA